jgi:CTP:molybdopterin cytidylyltransferase MocA
LNRWPIGTIILAAGASSRFGGRAPKGLSPVGKGTAMGRIADVATDLGLTPVVLVLGARAELLEPAGQARTDAIAENPDWAQGRTGSIQRGLEKLPEGSAALVWPVDVPFVSPSTLDRLLAAAREPGLAQWWTPTWDGRGGHPILLSPWAARQVEALPKEFPLRDAPFRQGVAERRVPVQDPGILDNLNTRDAFVRAEAAWRRRERI